MSYVNGKAPSRCVTCRAIVKKTVEPAGKAAKWTSQRKASEILEGLFPEYDCIRDGFYSWMRSPKNQFLQLDWYCPELKLAAEYEGIQHYQYTKHFHKTKREFDYLQACDRVKVRACQDRGITLLIIKYDRTLTTQWLIQEVVSRRPDLAALIARKMG